MTRTLRTQDDRPWWRYPHVWLIISGPLIVVLASIATAILAFQTNDVIMDDAHPPSLNPVQLRSLAPAELAKAHAATPLEVNLAKKPKSVEASLEPVVRGEPSPSSMLPQPGTPRP